MYDIQNPNQILNQSYSNILICKSNSFIKYYITYQ
jgi:hypothetical protein